ncbi:MAG: conjugative transposon protein TraM [Flavobacteriales bacterium]
MKTNEILHTVKTYVLENKEKVYIAAAVLGGVVLMSLLSAGENKNQIKKGDVSFSIPMEEIKDSTFSILPDKKQNPLKEGAFSLEQEMPKNEATEELLKELDKLDKMSYYDESSEGNTSSYPVYESPKTQTYSAPRTAQTPKAQEEEEEDAMQVWVAPSNTKTSGTGTTSRQLVKALLQGTNKKNNIVTPQSNRVKIQTKEDFYFQGALIPKYTNLIAYAQFGNELSLTIKYLMIKGNQVPCEISVIDSYGQPAIEVVGGTGAENEATVGEEVGQDIASNNEVQKVPGADGVVRSIFKKKIKAKVNTDWVFLKINQEK